MTPWIITLVGVGIATFAQVMAFGLLLWRGGIAVGNIESSLRTLATSFDKFTTEWHSVFGPGGVFADLSDRVARVEERIEGDGR